MSQKLFEYAILFHPKKTKEQNELGQDPNSVIVSPVKYILAKDDKIAAMLAARDIDQKYVDEGKLDQVEILVRPF